MPDTNTVREAILAALTAANDIATKRGWNAALLGTAKLLEAVAEQHPANAPLLRGIMAQVLDNLHPDVVVDAAQVVLTPDGLFS